MHHQRPTLTSHLSVLRLFCMKLVLNISATPMQAPSHITWKISFYLLLHDRFWKQRNPVDLVGWSEALFLSPCLRVFDKSAHFCTDGISVRKPSPVVLLRIHFGYSNESVSDMAGKAKIVDRERVKVFNVSKSLERLCNVLQHMNFRVYRFLLSRLAKISSPVRKKIPIHVSKQTQEQKNLQARWIHIVDDSHCQIMFFRPCKARIQQYILIPCRWPRPEMKNACRSFYNLCLLTFLPRWSIW